MKLFDYIWLFTIIMCVRLQNTLFHYCNLVCVYLAYLKKECGIILYQEWNAVIEVWSFWSATLERISYEVDNCCLHFSYQQLKLFAWWGICRVSNIEERRQDLIRTAGGHLRWINLNLLNLKEDWQEVGEQEQHVHETYFQVQIVIYILNLFKRVGTYSYVKHCSRESEFSYVWCTKVFFFDEQDVGQFLFLMNKYIFNWNWLSERQT